MTIEFLNRSFRLRTQELNGVYKVVLRCPIHKELFLQEVPLLLEEGKVPTVIFGNSTALPVPVPETWFQSLDDQSRQELQWVLPKTVNVEAKNYNEKQGLRYDRILKRIESVIDPTVLMRLIQMRKISAHLEQKARELKWTRQTLARDLNRYFVLGDKVMAAKLALHIVRDQNVDRKKHEKQGRPSKREEKEHDLKPAFVDASKEILTSIDAFIKASDETESHASLYRKWRTEFAIRTQICADGTLICAPNESMNISEGTFRYHLKKLKTAQERQVIKVGQKNFNLKHRAQTGTAFDLFPYPGHSYIIDSTVLDVYLVCAADRQLLIGRPVVYIVIDAWSWTILSIHVALEGPDLKQAKIALYRALMPKEALLQRLGKLHLLPFLPAGPIPLSIFSDRAELLSKGGDELSDGWGIRGSFAAAYRADWKSLVERLFGILNELVVHWVPGAVRKRVRERGDRDVRLDAVLTMVGLEKLLWVLAAEWNQTKDMSSHASIALIRAAIDANPLSFLRWGCENLVPDRRYMDRGEAITQLLPAEDALVNAQGFHVFDERLRFAAEWMRDDAFYDMRAKGAAHVYCDPDMPLRAYASVPVNGATELREIQLVGRAGLDQEEAITIEDVRELEAWTELSHGDKAGSRRFVSDVAGKERALVLADEAEKTNAARAADHRSKTNRVKTIRTNRSGSKGRQRLALADAQPAPSNSTKAPETMPVDRVYESFLSQLIGQ